MDELTIQLEEIYHAFTSRPPFLSLQQAASFLHVDTRTLLADGSFPIKKLGKQYRVSSVGMARWILKEVKK